MKKKPQIQIHHEDDETVEITLGKATIALLTHDEHGWSGMEAVEAAVRRLAKKFDIEVIES